MEHKGRGGSDIVGHTPPPPPLAGLPALHPATQDPWGIAALLDVQVKVLTCPEPTFFSVWNWTHFGSRAKKDFRDHGVRLLHFKVGKWKSRERGPGSSPFS